MGEYCREILDKVPNTKPCSNHCCFQMAKWKIADVLCSLQTKPWRQLVSHDRMQSDVTWRTVTSSTRRRERTSASVDEQDKMADWVVSTSHRQTRCTLYSQLPHQLSSSSNTTSSSTWKVRALIRRNRRSSYSYIFCWTSPSVYFLLFIFSPLSGPTVYLSSSLSRCHPSQSLTKFRSTLTPVDDGLTGAKSVAHINEVTERGARLILRWVTVRGYIPCL